MIQLHGWDEHGLVEAWAGFPRGHESLAGAVRLSNEKLCCFFDERMFVDLVDENVGIAPF
jgi:hypothetical protein